MKFTITGPVTLGTLVRNAGYVGANFFSDGSKFVIIRNLSFTYTPPTPPATGYEFTEQGPVFVEHGDLKRLDGTTKPGSVEKNFITTGPEAGWDVDNPEGRDADPERYISDAEAYPILNGEVHNITTFNLDNIHITVCPGDSVDIYVAIE